MEQNSNITLYETAAETIKTAILQGQYEALKSENRVQLAVYFGIGKFISSNSRNGGWGTDALSAISELLRKILPGLRGFSATQMKEMRLFYEGWNELDRNSSVTTDELRKVVSSVATEEMQTGSKAINTIDIYNSITISNLSDFPVNDFFRVPFTHHSLILRMAKSMAERFYYIHRCAEEHLSVRALKKLIESKAYQNQQALPNNFDRTIPTPKDARTAVMMFKDSYMLDFINVEELGERDIEDVDERVVEQNIVHNIKNFIMTFGKDFAFIGNQYHLEVYGVEHFPDLLFFNRELNCMVCIELKTGAFKSSYLGQLMTYLRILDDKVKKKHENPTIGIVLCTTANKDYVEYVIQDYNKPMGVATYKTFDDMPEELRKALPNMDDLKKLL